jgi:predicted  nucleic acid-binding Zn-ribbon protein
MQTLRALREKIAKLESEKANLLAELEGLREKAETKATSLEEEVAQLREEAESLKEMLNIL